VVFSRESQVDAGVVRGHWRTSRQCHPITNLLSLD
jgi:hypothetical protein